MNRRHNALSRKGITLIEILVAISIIAVLAAVAVLGIGKVVEGQKRTATGITLGTAKGLFAEYEASAGPGAALPQPPQVWNRAHKPQAGTRAIVLNFWKDSDPNEPGLNGLIAPDPRDLENATRQGEAQRQEILNSQIAMMMMLTVPANGNIMKQQNTDALFQAAKFPAYPESQQPLLADGWGNPILFVPASGLRGVTVGDQANRVVTTARTYTAAELPDTAVDLPPNARPFFVSAGPDGDFTKGDDNIYSFGN